MTNSSTSSGSTPLQSNVKPATGAASSERGKGSLAAFRGLLPFLLPYRRQFILAGIALVVAAGSTLAIPYAFKRMIEEAGGLWSGIAGTGGIAGSDLDAVLDAARDELVERMLTEVPFPADLDRELLRSALNCYAAFARVAGDEWLVRRTIDREQAAALMELSLRSLVEVVVPGMDRSD